MDEKKSKKIIKTAVIIGILVILAGVLSFVAFSGSSAKEMKVYFYPLDSNMSGDSCIITIGDIEILIDAGADDDAPGNIIIEKMKSVCKDKVWDYIIVTHPDSDHIAGFVDEKNGVFNFFEKNSE